MVEYVALLLMVVGLLLGILALFGIRKHGVSGILGPAVVGILINGSLIFIFVTNFMAARARAHGTRSDVRPNVERTEASRFAHFQFHRQWRLVPAAHACRHLRP
jgi:hypothetical protein